jgi:hypothetical protein
MARRQRTEREIYWQDLIDRQEAGRQSIADFCEGERVSTASFYAWRSRLRSLRQPAHPQTPRPALVPVQIVSERPTVCEAVTIEWPGGIVLRVATGCDAVTLRAVLTTLVSETAREADRC